MARKRSLDFDEELDGTEAALLVEQPENAIVEKSTSIPGILKQMKEKLENENTAPADSTDTAIADATSEDTDTDTDTDTGATAADTDEQYSSNTKKVFGSSSEARRALVKTSRSKTTAKPRAEKKASTAAVSELSFVPEVVTDFALPVRKGKQGKWKELAQTLASGEAVVNLPNRQAAISLKQALKAAGKRSTVAKVSDSVFAVKVL